MMKNEEKIANILTHGGLNYTATNYTKLAHAERWSVSKDTTRKKWWILQCRSEAIKQFWISTLFSARLFRFLHLNHSKFISNRIGYSNFVEDHVSHKLFTKKLDFLLLPIKLLSLTYNLLLSKKTTRNQSFIFINIQILVFAYYLPTKSEINGDKSNHNLFITGKALQYIFV